MHTHTHTYTHLHTCPGANTLGRGETWSLDAVAPLCGVIWDERSQHRRRRLLLLLLLLHLLLDRLLLPILARGCCYPRS